MKDANMTQDQIDRRIEELDAIVVTCQLRHSIKRIETLFNARLSQNIESARSLVRQIHAIAGGRRSASLPEKVDAKESEA